VFQHRVGDDVIEGTRAERKRARVPHDIRVPASHVYADIAMTEDVTNRMTVVGAAASEVENVERADTSGENGQMSALALSGTGPA
jgi:hypothetical protein